MNPDKVRKECAALTTIRGRWRLRGWKFSPLERIDGTNATLESIDALRNSPVCWSSFSREHGICDLLEDIEDAYRYALAPWSEHKTVFDCEKKSSSFLRWPDGTFPASVQRDARRRFFELASTTRFAVDAVPSVSNLQQLNFPFGKITLLHVASLAAMVCIIEAIQSLEQIECWWREDSRPYRAGKPFDWLAEHDRETMTAILSVVLKTAKKIEPHKQQVSDSRSALDKANAWLSHLATMTSHHDEVANQLAKVAKTEKSKKAQTAAKTLRAEISTQDVADYFNANAGGKWGRLQAELAEIHGVSEATIARRYRLAKKNNLLS